MSRDDIIRMAREAGLASIDINDRRENHRKLERFAALVAAHEREQCANLVQENAMACEDGSIVRSFLASNAAAIRARGQT